MKTFRDLLGEAKVGRAWAGKLKRAEELVTWMADNGIMTKGDVSKKDILFRKYYRFYNDGDVPRGKLYPKVYSYSIISKEEKANISAILETEIEDFFKNVLSKYLPQIDRKGFRIDKEISVLDSIVEVLTDERWEALVVYQKDLKDSIVGDKINEVVTRYDAVKEDVNKFIEGTNFDQFGLDYYSTPSETFILRHNIKLINGTSIQLPSNIDKKLIELKKLTSDALELAKTAHLSLVKLKGLNKNNK